jgi:hypothetical protein
MSRMKTDAIRVAVIIAFRHCSAQISAAARNFRHRKITMNPGLRYAGFVATVAKGSKAFLCRECKRRLVRFGFTLQGKGALTVRSQVWPCEMAVRLKVRAREFVVAISRIGKFQGHFVLGDRGCRSGSLPLGLLRAPSSVTRTTFFAPPNLSHSFTSCSALINFTSERASIRLL